MKTYFFQQIAGLGFKGNFLLNINQDETGVQTVLVVLKKDKAIDGLPPILGVSDIQTTLFRGKLTTCFAGKEMQQML